MILGRRIRCQEVGLLEVLNLSQAIPVEILKNGIDKKFPRVSSLV